MSIKKLLLTLLVAGITSTTIAAPKGPPTPGCWPPSACIPVNKGVVFLIVAGVGIAYLAVRKKNLSMN